MIDILLKHSHEHSINVCGEAAPNITGMLVSSLTATIPLQLWWLVNGILYFVCLISFSNFVINILKFYVSDQTAPLPDE